MSQEARKRLSDSPRMIIAVLAHSSRSFKDPFVLHAAEIGKHRALCGKSTDGMIANTGEALRPSFEIERCRRCGEALVELGSGWRQEGDLNGRGRPLDALHGEL